MALMYGLFALGVVTAAASLLILRTLRVSHSARKMRLVVSWHARVWLAIAQSLRVLRVTHTGTHPQQGLVLANHPSLIDAVICWALLPDVICVLKADLAHNPLLRIVADGMGYVSNADPEQMLGDAQRVLERGGLLLLFPEGTRTQTDGQPVFRTGAAEVALRTNAAIYPLVIHYDGAYLKKGVPWYAFPGAAPHFELNFEGAWPQPATSQNRRKDRRALTQALETHFRQALAG